MQSPSHHPFRSSRTASGGSQRCGAEEEEQQLRDAFTHSEPLADIATKHGRTLRAIEARLERLGLLAADQRVTDNSFFTSPTKRGEGE